MNTQHILDVAGRYISGINEVQANIFKGTLNVANRPAGVYYFDLSNQPPEDFEAYQEKLLADEFYAHPGNLQWNYYLFLLNDQLGPKAKEHIEKNDKYARKYVLTEAEFHDFFTLEKSDATIRPNIVAEWKQRLDAVGLEDVYSNCTYVNLVSQFKAKGTTAVKKAAVQRSADDNDKIRFIDRLVLQPGYRPYPVQRAFDFGKVNLFRGINGVGKTSLFEAIEAMICGRCLRNPSDVLPNGSIQAEFNHSKGLVPYDGANNRRYIDRDLRWYATNSRSNTLYHSFNRFNFFNADAAHNFSIAATEKDASEALFAIILGPEYHYISERNVGTLERLRPEYNRLKEEMEKERQREQRNARFIQNYKEPASLVRLREAIRTTYEEIGFKEAATLEELAVIEERHNQLRAILSGLLRDEQTVLTLAEFDVALAAFQEKSDKLADQEKALRTLTEKQTGLVAEGKRLSSHYDFLSRCLTYVQDEQLMQLEGLQAREGAANLQSSKIAIVKDLIAEIGPGSTAITMDEPDLSAAVAAQQAAIKNSEKEVNDLLKNLGQLESIVRQIRSHGREFLLLDHDATDCPLCQWDFEREELERRINREDTAAKADPAAGFDLLRRAIEKMKDSLKGLETAQQLQRKLAQAYTTAFPGKAIADRAAALTELITFKDQEGQISQEIYDLAEVRKHAEQNDRSEKEYSELKFAFRQYYLDGPEFAVGQAAALQGLIDGVSASVAENKKEEENNAAVRTLTGNQIKRLLGVEGNSMYLKDIRELLDKEEKRMQTLEIATDKLRELLEPNDTRPFSELEELAATLQNHILSLREEQKVQFEYDMAKKDQAEAAAFIEANAARLLKYERAVETLRALTGDEASAHVAAFFNDNFQEIVDIFKSIHAPKEFRTLNYVDDRLELITEEGKSRSISQISTGQRSALALAIFLSLNGKLANGPNIIMFDDPVAFIDDLNALSFLDHLRVHTLRSERQIFFATANMRLAGLFEKKFGFLGEDFKRFQFEREAIVN